MCSRQVCVLALAALAGIVFAQPPAAYGPPNYNPGSRTTITSTGGSPGIISSPGRTIITNTPTVTRTVITGGSSYTGSEESGAPEPYSYAYEIKDAPTGNDYSSTANSDGKTVQGEYRVLLPDGRRQIVKYTADDTGYNADVQYEGQARYPVTVPRAPSTVTQVVSAPVVSSGGSNTIITNPAPSTGGSFGGYRY